jgi:hypothetical protein
MREIQISQTTECTEQCKRNWRECIDRIPESNLRYEPKGKRS